jgi:hypothetical protein
MRNAKDIRSIDTDFCFPANGITAYQWKIGSEYIPAQEISCTDGGSRALAELRKGLGIYDNRRALNMITEYNFLPVVPPNQLDTADFTEIRRGCSQPSSFFMALDLEKSPGQASGFDSAASSVDIELILNLRKHYDIHGAQGGNTKFTGSDSTAKFQPSKRRVILTQIGHDIATSKPVAAYGDCFTYHDRDVFAGDGHTLLATDANACCEGLMLDANLIYKVDTNDAGIAEATFDGSQWAVTDNSSGNYARVYFYAHIDQVLRLSAVGRMEVIR